MSNTPNRTASEETIHKALAALAEKHGMSEAEVLRQALAFKDALDGAVPPPASEAGEALASPATVDFYDAVATFDLKALEGMRDQRDALRASLTAAESALTERSNEVAALKLRLRNAYELPANPLMRSTKPGYVSGEMSSVPCAQMIASTALHDRDAAEARVAELEEGLRDARQEVRFHHDGNAGRPCSCPSCKNDPWGALLSPRDPDLPAPGEGEGA